MVGSVDSRQAELEGRLEQQQDSDNCLCESHCGLGMGGPADGYLVAVVHGRVQDRQTGFGLAYWKNNEGVMCEKARYKLAALIKEHGEDSTEMKKMKIICDEFDNMDGKINSLTDDVSALKANVGKVQEEMKENTRISLETQATVNRIYAKWDDGQVEKDAAVMNFFRSLVGTKVGKLFLAFLFIFGGLACAYLIEHAEQLSHLF